MKIVKCDGCYHGHGDSLLVKAGSGGATFGIPNSAGIPRELAKLTITIPYNDAEALERILKKEARSIAAFIVEPVAANMGVVPPRPGYLEAVRKLTRRHGVLLIFDEVITGFRLALGGAQEYFGVKADLTCLGKILGGGLPIGAFGGRRQIMDCLAPEGKVYQAGTLSGNPLATAAGIATLKPLFSPRFYDELNQKSAEFYEELDRSAKIVRRGAQLNRISSLFTFFFSKHAVTDYASAKRSDTRRYARFFHALIQHGIYLAPSQFEANFISQVITDKQLRTVSKSIVEVLR
jgi:glutamate-1-semialdehyde 2,1-aminomutase